MTPAELMDGHLAEALDALLVRVRWYEVRRRQVPAITAAAFNALADALGKPDKRPWKRVT